MHLPKWTIFLGLTVFITVFLTACRDNSSGTDTEVTQSGLLINTVKPIKGKFGTKIVITGTGFSETTAENTITFNGKIAEVTSATSTTLTTIVPKGAQSGPVNVHVNKDKAVGPAFIYIPTVNVTTFAGSGAPGFRDGADDFARFSNPVGLELTETGELIVVDHWNHSIRIVTPDGYVSTLAGNGKPGFSNGQGADARFFRPTDVEIADDGSIYIADFANHQIRHVTKSGQVTTFAGSVKGYHDGPVYSALFSYPAGIALQDDTLYVSDSESNRIRWISIQGDVGTYAGSGRRGFQNGYGQMAEFYYPFGIDFGNEGRLFLADYGNNSIRLISSEPFVSTFSGSGEPGYNNDEGDKAQYNSPYDVAVDANNMIYVADFDNHRIRRISPYRQVIDIAGTGEPGLVNGDESVAQFNNPIGLAVNEEGTVLYVADHANHVIRKITIE